MLLSDQCEEGGGERKKFHEAMLRYLQPEIQLQISFHFAMANMGVALEG